MWQLARRQPVSLVEKITGLACAVPAPLPGWSPAAASIVSRAARQVMASPVRLERIAGIAQTLALIVRGKHAATDHTGLGGRMR
jgi:hypothetical protein